MLQHPIINILIRSLPPLNRILYRNTSLIEELLAAFITTFSLHLTMILILIFILIQNHSLQIDFVLRRVKLYSTWHVHVLSCVLIQSILILDLLINYKYRVSLSFRVS
jgi:hypothetical protein